MVCSILHKNMKKLEKRARKLDGKDEDEGDGKLVYIQPHAQKSLPWKNIFFSLFVIPFNTCVYWVDTDPC